MAGSISNPSPLDLMLFHKLERDFYGRLVRQLNQNQERMKQVIALWLWFESIGHHDFIRYVSSYQHNDIVLGFVVEAEACLDRLVGHRDPTRGDELPLTASLMAEDMDLRFFEYQRDQAINGVRRFYHNVCHIIFDDELMERVARDANHPDQRRLLSSGLQYIAASSSSSAASSSRSDQATGSSQEGTSHQLRATPVSTVQPPLPRFMLNPMARPWSPEMNQSPDDQRSMFITFSRGHPISREDIIEFFNARYGPCLEVVMIERAPPGQPPMYGRLVFTSASMIAMVLNGQRTAKFIIKGKHLWARMYMPRHN